MATVTPQTAIEPAPATVEGTPMMRGSTSSNPEPKAERADVFDSQVENLLRRRYHELARMRADAFVARHLAALRKRIPESNTTANEAQIPFVITVKNELVATHEAMSLVELAGRHGIVQMHPTNPNEFSPIDGLGIPEGAAYLITQVDTGRATLNVTPDDALKTILDEARSPLTIDEAVALVTHYPELLTSRNCFSILGSRRGDRRVPALWISRGHPRLGWCWAGNPHTWLGSASCRARVGA